MKKPLQVALLATATAVASCDRKPAGNLDRAAKPRAANVHDGMLQIGVDPDGILFVTWGTYRRETRAISKRMSFRRLLRERSRKEKDAGATILLDPKDPWTDVLPLINQLQAEGFSHVLLSVGTGDGKAAKVRFPGWRGISGAFHGDIEQRSNAVTVELDRNSDLWINFRRIGKIDDVDRHILSRVVRAIPNLPILLCIEQSLSSAVAVQGIALCERAGASHIILRPRRLCGALTHAVPWSTVVEKEWGAAQQGAAAKATWAILQDLCRLKDDRITNAVASLAGEIPQPPVKGMGVPAAPTIDDLKNELTELTSRDLNVARNSIPGIYSAIARIYHEIRGTEWVRTTRAHAWDGIRLSEMTAVMAQPLRATDPARLADMLSCDARRLRRLNTETLLEEEARPAFDYGDYPVWVRWQAGHLWAVPGLRIPAKRAMKEAQIIEWIQLDEWYVVGPFPNPKRKNLRRSFSPEETVDLDMHYTGKSGRRLEWQYIQSNTKQCFTPLQEDQTIWYAWTEIHSDRDVEISGMFGCSETGKVWLNGEHIFSSGLVPHPWTLDRGWM